MPEPIRIPSVEGLQHELKASNVRGMIAALKSLGKFDAVVALLGPGARALLLDPPPITAWVSGVSNLEIVLAIESLGGPALVRQVALEGTRSAIVPVLRPLLDGIMRLFGVGPAGIFRNLQRFTDQTARGVEIGYEPTSESSGMVTIRMLGSSNVPAIAFVSMAGSIEVAFELCKVTGALGEITVTRPPRATEARIPVRWQR